MNNPMSTVDKFITGVIGIGVITAFALHAGPLAQLVKATGTASSQVMGTAEKG